MQTQNWNNIIEYIRNNMPPHKEICIPEEKLPNPQTIGFKKSIGQGPGTHYRHPLPDKTGIHIRHHNKKYCIHWDKCDPTKGGIICHLTKDSPQQIIKALLITILLYIIKHL